MGRDALWLVLVMLLGASLLLLLLPEDEAVSVNEEDTEEEVVEESTCLVGTQKVLNASATDGTIVCRSTRMPCSTRIPLPCCRSQT